MLTGDFLFIGEAGAGRTDLPTGDPEEHFESLQKLQEFPDQLQLFPAHDYRGQTHSTLGQERRTNPRRQVTSKDEYVRRLESLAAAPPAWMLDVVMSNYFCTQDTQAVWIPVDLPTCEVKGPLTLGVDSQPVKTITPEEAKQQVDTEQERVLVLDVREEDEYIGDLGHTPRSLLIPIGELPRRLDELEPQRGRAVITVCKSGGRSHTAAGILMQAGVTGVATLGGGMLEWNELGYPVTRESAR